jgi:hypothetical protein
MPIRESQKALYPRNWKTIRKSIIERSGGQCECVTECGLHSDHRCIEVNYTKAVYAHGRIILTVAHLNNDPTDNRPENLKAMCQRCHNRYDQTYRQKNARRTRFLKRQNPNQIEFSDGIDKQQSVETLNRVFEMGMIGKKFILDEK